MLQLVLCLHSHCGVMKNTWNMQVFLSGANCKLFHGPCFFFRIRTSRDISCIWVSTGGTDGGGRSSNPQMVTKPWRQRLMLGRGQRKHYWNSWAVWKQSWTHWSAHHQVNLHLLCIVHWRGTMFWPCGLGHNQHDHFCSGRLFLNGWLSKRGFKTGWFVFLVLLSFSNAFT